jgi:hypothetical protein
LHDIDIPSWAAERVIKHRGAEHVFTDLDPAKTALIVIDMQNAFMLPGVAFVEIETAPEIVPNINRLAAVGGRDGGVDRHDAYRRRRGRPVHLEDPLLRPHPGFQRAGRLPAGARHRHTADHNAALTAFFSTFGDIMATEMLVDLLGRG